MSGLKTKKHKTKNKTKLLMLALGGLLVLGFLIFGRDDIRAFFRPWWQKEEPLEKIFSDSKYQLPQERTDSFVFGRTDKDFSKKETEQGSGKLDGKDSKTVLSKDFFQGLEIQTSFGNLKLVPLPAGQAGLPQDADIFQPGYAYKNSVVFESKDKVIAYLYDQNEHQLKEFIAIKKFTPSGDEKEPTLRSWRIVNQPDYRISYEQDGGIGFYGAPPQYKNSSTTPLYKDFQYFKIPAPVVIENSVEAFWEVSGDILSLKIKNWVNTDSPLIIDPAVVIGAGKVTDPAKKVKDEHTKKLIQDQGMDPDYVELHKDYGKRAEGKSPYAKTYRDNLTGKYVMEVQGLPMVDDQGTPVDPQWEQAGQNYKEKSNLFNITVKKNGNTKIKVKNDQPDGRKQNDQLTFQPQLFLNDVEQAAGDPTLLAIDPVNENYQNNVLEWDYGIAKRRLRLIEGKVLGSWVFAANPNGDVRIVYNQVGDYKLKLGQFRFNDDEEIVSASAFNSATYPFTVSDSATYNPDANPETTSVDGRAHHNQVLSWANLIIAAGNGANDSDTTFAVTFIEAAATPNFDWLTRAIVLFDTSGLADTAIVSAATLSLRGSAKAQTGTNNIDTDVNIYVSTPASNTAIATGDYAQVGSVAQSTAITYANWSTTGYNNYALNDMSKIILTGVSKFGTRNATYDVGATTPPHNGTYHYGYINSYASEQGAGYQPKLVVTYTLPYTPRPSGVQPSGGSFLMF